MTTPASVFIRHLQDMAEQDRGALAVLRRSIGFAPGTYPQAFQYVERHVVGHSEYGRSARYLVAALFALHPKQLDGVSLAMAFGRLRQKRESGSIEQRFIALLAADAEQLPTPLRQAVSLLKADEFGFDYAALEEDLAIWSNPFDSEKRDRIRQRWARDFYRALANVQDDSAAISEQTN